MTTHQFYRPRALTVCLKVPLAFAIVAGLCPIIGRQGCNRKESDKEDAKGNHGTEARRRIMSVGREEQLLQETRRLYREDEVVSNVEHNSTYYPCRIPTHPCSASARWAGIRRLHGNEESRRYGEHPGN